MIAANEIPKELAALGVTEIRQADGVVIVVVKTGNLELPDAILSMPASASGNFLPSYETPREERQRLWREAMAEIEALAQEAPRDPPKPRRWEEPVRQRPRSQHRPVAFSRGSARGFRR